SLRSRAAMPPIPSSPKWRRPGQAALAQSAESPIEIPETSEGEGRNLIHLSGADWWKPSANPPELSGSRCKRPSEMLQRRHSNAVLLQRTDKMKRVRWRVECGHPTSHRSFL